MKISNASKMPCRSWSLQAGKPSKGGTCPASIDPETGEYVDACKGCYALQGTYRFKNVKLSREHNMRDWKRDAWVSDMVLELDNERYFRWFDSGDMYSLKLAEKIYSVMTLTPWIKHWLPTRMHKFTKFNNILRAMGELPNVCVRRSSDSVLGEYTAGLHGSTISGRLEKNENGKKVFIGEIPQGTELCRAFENGDKCGTCRACWSKDGNVITYPGHGSSMNKVQTLNLIKLKEAA